jgi:Peptidase inhibitor I9
VLRRAASAKTVHRYSVTFNGFAASMTAADAAKLATTPGVKAVIKDEKRKLDTTRTPEFLGLTKRAGVWDQLGGPRRNAGAGVVVADRPVAAAAPEQVTGTGTSGSAAVSVIPGFTGTLSTAVDGLVAADVRQPVLQPTGPGFDPDNPATSARTAKETLTVPAGTTVAQHSTFDADFAAGTDVDLFLYEAGTSNLVAQSAGGSAEETIRIEDPPAGSYDLYVVLFGVAQGTTTLTVPTYLWNLDGTAKGNLTVTPASTAATAGTPVTLTAAWSGLSTGTRYLGRISYSDGTTTTGGTFVRVDTT